MVEQKTAHLLDAYYAQVKGIILDKQNPITGLLPASTAITTHGDYTDAWVRDNVYSILAVWGLALSYRNIDEDNGRGFELEQSTVKLMRGLLQSMMKQSAKVEAFKKTQYLHDALHAKYETDTGNVVVGDHEWGHLQIDATSLFLLTATQMIASGLDVIWTLDEVNFIQNLVYYIERAYRTADYGIWERGAKSNAGNAELNASSLGMAKAALEALSGFNLFGSRGDQSSIIHVIPDNIAQSDITLKSLLPRESNTKEIDAALLSIIGYPAFAVPNTELRDKTRKQIINKLQGQYGLKRFLRDGHQTVVEDGHRLHYEQEELQQFQNIESEWPLFYTYLYLDALFRKDESQTLLYEQLLEDVLVKEGEYDLLPELYYVPEENVEAERANPHSQKRVPNENVPLVWAQSLYLLGRMVRDGLLHLNDIDPIGRRHYVKYRKPTVQLLIVAEDKALQEELAEYNILSSTPDELEPFTLFHRHAIGEAYEQVGRNDKLKLTGRFGRNMKSLTTSRIYYLAGKPVLCISPFVAQDFYLAYDTDFLIKRFRSEIAYIHRNWTQLGRPLVTLFLTHSLLNGDRTEFYKIAQEAWGGKIGGVPIRTGLLSKLLPTASFERIDNLHGLTFSGESLNEAKDHTPILAHSENMKAVGYSQAIDIELSDDVSALVEQLQNTDNLYLQIEILAALVRLQGLDTLISINGQDVSLESLLEEIYEQSGRLRVWSVVRRAAGLLSKWETNLEIALSAILVRQKNIQVGRAYNENSLITRPISVWELLEKIQEYCREDTRDKVLTQELLIYISLLIKADPDLFKSLITIRIGHIILLLIAQVSRESSLTPDEAYDKLMSYAPSELQRRLRLVIEQYHDSRSIAQKMEALHAKNGGSLQWSPDSKVALIEEPAEGWLGWRQYRGVFTRISDNFHKNVWASFQNSRGVTIGDKFEWINRMNSSTVLSDMTPEEKSFALRIEHLMNKIPAAEYRQLNMEALTVLSRFFKQNPDLYIDDYIVLDVMIGHAVRIAYSERFPDRIDAYDNFKSQAWDEFYDSSPARTNDALVKSLRYLIEADGVLG